MKLFKRRDSLLILTLLLISAGGWALLRIRSGPPGAVAQVVVEQKVVLHIHLVKNQAQDFTLPERPGIVFHRDSEGAVAFTHSNCPDKICVKTGKISKGGQFAACLPNQTILRIHAKGDAQEIDSITGH